MAVRSRAHPTRAHFKLAGSEAKARTWLLERLGRQKAPYNVDTASGAAWTIYVESLMLTRRIILEQLDAYLNGRLTLAALVDWAEIMLIEPDIAADEDAEALMNVLTYLGAADTHGFPLTWDMLTSFVEQLGGTLKAAVYA